jgi:hypothetical protein
MIYFVIIRDISVNLLCGPLPDTQPSPAVLIARNNHWDCDLPSWCTVETCNGANTPCESVPFGSCSSVIIGGDPHGWDSHGNPFELPSNPKSTVVYRVFRDSLIEVLVSVEHQFVRDIQVKSLLSDQLMFHAKFNSILEAEFFWKQELLQVPMIFSDSGVEISTFFIDSEYIHNELTGLNQLSRYQTVGIHVGSMIHVVGGLHPGAGGFFNFQIIPDHSTSHVDEEFPSVVQLLYSVSNHHLRSVEEWADLFSAAVVPSPQ